MQYYDCAVPEEEVVSVGIMMLRMFVSADSSPQGHDTARLRWSLWQDPRDGHAAGPGRRHQRQGRQEEDCSPQSYRRVR